MSETPSSGNNAQHEPDQDLFRFVVIGTFWLMKPSGARVWQLHSQTKFVNAKSPTICEHLMIHIPM
jgi:hypothetical protein